MAWTTPENCPFPLGICAPIKYIVPWSHQSLHPQRHVDRLNCFCTAHCSVILLDNGPLCFPQKLPIQLGGSGPPSNTWYIRPTRVINPNGISIGSAVFVWVPNAMLYNENPRSCPFPLGFCHPARGGSSYIHRQHAQKIWYRLHMWYRWYPHGKTHTHTDEHITILYHCSLKK